MCMQEGVVCVYARRCCVCVCKKVLHVCMQEGAEAIACVDMQPAGIGTGGMMPVFSSI